MNEKRKIKEFRFKKNTKMPDLIGHFAETNQQVGDFPAGFQFIILKPLDHSNDPLFLVEQRGRLGSVHFSEMTVFELTAPI